MSFDLADGKAPALGLGAHGTDPQLALAALAGKSGAKPALRRVEFNIRSRPRHLSISDAERIGMVRSGSCSYL